jgi:ATP/maltotriose-dependent transcriptional regulator MalT
VVASAANNRWFMAYCLNELGNAACALNEFAAAKGYYEASYAIRKAFDDPEGMAVALNHLGKIALSQQNYPEAKSLYQQSLAIYLQINDKGGLATALTGLGSAAWPLGEYDAARHYYQEALQIATDMAYTPLILSILVGVGDLLLHLGRQKRGIELLALACHHPASDHETKDRACRLLSQRQAEIPADILAVAIQNGKSADLANWVTRVQVELVMPVEVEVSKKEAAAVGSPAAASLHPANAALVEPLTSRELEVLQLIAEGKTNQQMAETLVISVGTAKWYTSQIYGKLNVSSRTQAVAKARELALLA